MNRFFNRLLGGSPPSSSKAAAPAPGAPRPPAGPPLEPPEPESEGLLAFFTEDHRACDREWALVEGESDGDAAAFLAAVKTFDAALRRHLAMEEEIMFPAFEEATGMVGGPTQVMRGEHVQMRAVLDEIGRLAARDDRRGVLDQGDTLMMLIQQHNVKEENMLYPMADEFLGRTWSVLRARLAAY